MGSNGDEDRKTTPFMAGSLVARALLAGMVFVAAGKITQRSRKTDGAPKRVKAFTQPYDGHTLSQAQKDQLEAGRKVIFSAREAGATGGRGTAVCDVEAPPSVVWKTVLGFERYKGRLAQCKYSNVYERKKNVMKRTETIKVHMKLDGIVKDFNCYYDHTYKPDAHMLTWTLDLDHKSDFLDVQGQWVVEKHPSKADWSRVYYSADVLLPAWLPKMVVTTLCKTGGTKALSFVKKDSEAAFSSTSVSFADKLKSKLTGGATGRTALKTSLRPRLPTFAARHRVAKRR